jgi:hypothetical protein
MTGGLAALPSLLEDNQRELSPSCNPDANMEAQGHSNVTVTRALLMEGLEVDRLVTEQLAVEAQRTALCTAGELNEVWLGYLHYSLNEPLWFLDKTCMSTESPTLCCMLDVVRVVLSMGPCTSQDVDMDVWTMLPFLDSLVNKLHV